METLHSIFTPAMLLGLVATVASVGGVWLLARLARALDAAKIDDAAKQAINTGAHVAFEGMLARFKSAAADGKITPEEWGDMRREAIRQATGFAARNGVALAKTLALPMVESLATKALARLMEAHPLAPVAVDLSEVPTPPAGAIIKIGGKP